LFSPGGVKGKEKGGGETKRVIYLKLSEEGCTGEKPCRGEGILSPKYKNAESNPKEKKHNVGMEGKKKFRGAWVAKKRSTKTGRRGGGGRVRKGFWKKAVGMGDSKKPGVKKEKLGSFAAKKGARRGDFRP